MSREPETYDIFKEYEILESIEWEVSRNYATESDDTRLCNELAFNSNPEFTTICKKFVTLFNAFKRECSPSESAWIKKKYPEFINFWLNNQLYMSAYNEDKIKEFYKKLEPKLHEFGANNALKDKMYVINKKYLNNMSFLYQLYKFFYTSEDKQYSTCDNILDKFKNNYNTALNKCYYDGDIKLCRGILGFNELYKSRVSKSVPKCKTIMSPELPELTLFDTDISTILKNSKIGRDLRMLIQIETLDKISHLKSEKYGDLKYLISLYYNLLFEPDEIKKKYNMINVLYQFIQYCNENKKNLNLSLFMEEFIKEYYKKKEVVYKAIFKECETDPNTKTYCQLHNECNHKFGKDLSLIKNNSSQYIEQQVKYIENLSAFDLWIIEAKAIFQDFDAMSRMLPIVMSTIVAIVVFLFFLYKLAPLSSFFRKEKKRKKIPLFYPEIRTLDVNDNNSRRMNGKTKRGKIRFAYQPS